MAEPGHPQPGQVSMGSGPVETVQARALMKRAASSGHALEGTIVSDPWPVDVDHTLWGLTSLYITMRERFDTYVPLTIQTLAIVLWALFALTGASLIQLTPTVTLAGLIWFALLCWCVFVGFKLGTAFYYLHWWRRQEEFGMKFVTENDCTLRVILYRGRTGECILDHKTQQLRFADNANHESRARDYLKTLRFRMFVAFGSLFIIPLLFLIVPYLLGPQYWHDVQQALQPSQLIGWAQQVSPDLAHWLARPDVRRLWGMLSPPWIAEGWVFFWVFVPAFLRGASQAIDMDVRESGAQFIPDARVLEPRDVRVTRDTIRGQKTQGGAKFADPAEAALAVRSP